MSDTKILVIGANGQLGSVLVKELQKKYGLENIVASDILEKDDFNGNFKILDATNFNGIKELVVEDNITQIYHLAAILSAKGEQDPLHTWELNMKMMLNVFEVARLTKIEKVFFPSSIAVFGDAVQRNKTPQDSFLNPATVYGMSKAAGENWAQYYFDKYSLDVRSLRYPGVIGYQSMPGGGTTDYAVDIYHAAVQSEDYECFLNHDTELPMIFMEDAIRATIELMEAPKENIKTRTSYNIAGMSFTPAEITKSIQKYYPDFKVNYKPDYRQKIANKWPKSIDAKQAREDWNWKSIYDLKSMTKVMIEKLQLKYKASSAEI